MRLTVCDLRDLANRNSSGGCAHLRLAIAEGGDDSCGYNLRSDDLSITGLAGITATLHNEDFDRRALCSPGAIVKVEEVATCTLIENSRAAECEGAVSASGESSSEDGARLGRLIELELVVCGDVPGSALTILEDSVLEGSNQNAVGGTVIALLFETVSDITWP